MYNVRVNIVILTSQMLLDSIEYEYCLCTSTAERFHALPNEHRSHTGSGQLHPRTRGIQAMNIISLIGTCKLVIVYLRVYVNGRRDWFL